MMSTIKQTTFKQARDAKPWELSDRCIFDGDGNFIAVVYGAVSQANHTVDCVNACRGFDPEFVGQLLKSICEMRDLLEITEIKGT